MPLNGPVPGSAPRVRKKSAANSPPGVRVWRQRQSTASGTGPAPPPLPTTLGAPSPPPGGGGWESGASGGGGGARRSSKRCARHETRGRVCPLRLASLATSPAPRGRSPASSAKSSVVYPANGDRVAGASPGMANRLLSARITRRNDGRAGRRDVGRCGGENGG